MVHHFMIYDLTEEFFYRTEHINILHRVAESLHTLSRLNVLSVYSLQVSDSVNN
jgi:hypothetical protein